MWPFLATAVGLLEIAHALNRIVGGSEVPSQEMAPFAVSLSTFGCGGVLLSDRIVLSAGHCCDQGECIGKSARMGSLSSRSGGTVRSIAAACVMEGYREPPLSTNDVSIFVLDEPIQPSATISYGNIDNSALWAGGGAQGSTVTTLGWGQTEQGRSSETLRHVQQTITRCPSTVSDSLFCLTGRPGRDSCAGDSGGPVVQGDIGSTNVLGIVSYGPTVCGSYSSPVAIVNLTDPTVAGFIAKARAQCGPLSTLENPPWTTWGMGAPGAPIQPPVSSPGSSMQTFNISSDSGGAAVVIGAVVGSIALIVTALLYSCIITVICVAISRRKDRGLRRRTAFDPPRRIQPVVIRTGR